MFGSTDWTFGSGFSSNSADTASGYNWGGSSSLVEAGRGIFGDALNAWVTVEGMRQQANASGGAQSATRDATTYPSGAQMPSGGVAGTGLSAGHLLMGGAALVGLVLLLK